MLSATSVSSSSLVPGGDAGARHYRKGAIYWQLPDEHTLAKRFPYCLMMIWE